MRLVLLALALTACSHPLDTPDDQVDCTQFHDHASCLAAGCDIGPSCSCPNEPTNCIPKGAFVAPPSCSGACALAETSCEDLADSDTCNARPDCYALLSFDQTCDSEGCESHFVSCQTGPALCDGPTCPEPSGVRCVAPDTNVWASSDSCIAGCVDASKCPAP